MGLVPIFLMIASFLFVWAGVIYYTFKTYHQQAEQAKLARKSAQGNAYQAISMADLLAQGKAGGRLEPSWQTEYIYRTSLFRYNRLLSKPPYSVFGKWFGFKKLG
jgi:hypothetical protein